MTTAKTATTKRVRRTVDESVSDPENGQGWAFKRAARPKGWKSTGAVSLARSERMEPSKGWHSVTRALWNMGDAAETATGGNKFYARRRDEILSRLIRFVG